METRIIQREAFKVIGLSLETVLQAERKNKNIPKLHRAFEKRMTEIGNRLNDDSIGLFIDPPNYDYRTDPFKWVAGVEVSSFNEIPDGMEAITIPANTYACATYRGSIDENYRAYDFLYHWVEESEYELAGRYGLEVYPGQHEPGKTNEVMELMFPVQKI